MTLNSRECENCGASVPQSTAQCKYCGTWFEGQPEIAAAKPRAKKRPALLKLPLGAGEFGTTASGFVAAGLVIALMLYGFGWLFEDTQYWLDATAMFIWVGLLPLELAIIATVWQADRPVWVYGLVIAALIFALHCGLIWLIRGNLWDDHVGIAALIAGVNFGGWLLGRLAHASIRGMKIKT